MTDSSNSILSQEPLIEEACNEPFEDVLARIDHVLAELFDAGTKEVTLPADRISFILRSCSRLGGPGHSVVPCMEST